MWCRVGLPRSDVWEESAAPSSVPGNQSINPDVRLDKNFDIVTCSIEGRRYHATVCRRVLVA
jgi:hypothetical protein